MRMQSGYRVQGFVAEDTSEDGHIYEPVTCPVCHLIHHVNPHTGVVLAKRPNKAATRPSRLPLEVDVDERLPVGVADDEAGVGLLDGLGRRLALKAPHQ